MNNLVSKRRLDEHPPAAQAGGPAAVLHAIGCLCAPSIPASRRRQPSARRLI